MMTTSGKVVADRDFSKKSLLSFLLFPCKTKPLVGTVLKSV